MKSVALVLVFAGALLPSGPATADPDPDDCVASDAVRLSSHEPSLLGWTSDQSANGYMDFLLSVKLSIACAWVGKLTGDHGQVYFAFSGRFGQYLGRKSNPVIGKRFNPELFYRHRIGNNVHVDFGYGHESNGQQISTYSAYLEAQLSQERPEYAEDYISRGWDYAHAGLRVPLWRLDAEQDPLTMWFAFRRFVSGGILQGHPEEYNDWENDPNGKPRDEFDGIRLLWKYVHRFGHPRESVLSDLKVVVGYTTGYRDIFANNTVRFELGTKLFQIPVILWVVRGYNSDLVRYYKFGTATGIAIEVGAF